MSSPTLALNNICHSFSGKRALSNISLCLEPGTICSVVGPDGAGKTTLLRIAASLIIADSGKGKIFDHDLGKELDMVRSHIAYMPQKFGLYEDLTVGENLAFYRDIYNLKHSEYEKKRAEVLKSTALAPFLDRLTGKLSGGMKQKLAVACSLLASPSILLLDEPTVGVDPVSRRDLWQIISKAAHEQQLTVLLATTYLDEAEKSNKIILLDNGKELFQGTAKQFRSRVAGRVYNAAIQPNSKARDQLWQLSAHADIAYASLHAGKLRFVCKDKKSPPLEALPTTENCADAFMEIWPQQKLEKQQISHPPSNGEAVISCKNLCRKFGEFIAVEPITFSVKQGEIFALLGGNGAGKTTIFRMLCGLLKPSSGYVEITSEKVNKSSTSSRSRLGYMAQKFSLYNQLTVEQNITFFAKAYGLYGSKLKSALRQALKDFSLTEYRKSSVAELPAGHKQRLAMITATIHQPTILFLDEPTSGTDPIARREFWQRICSFAQQGMTVIVTTHYMEEAEFCDTILIMSQGKMLAMGTPEEIRARAATQKRPRPTIEDAFIAIAEEKI